MNDLLFITFDIKRDEYPTISYSIAALKAVLQNNNLTIAHHSVDIQHALEEKGSQCSVIEEVNSKLLDNISYFKKFKFIAIGLTAWSHDYCLRLLDLLESYTGKIILGGYEVTSTPAKLLMKAFPRVDYFIKGYAERAIKELILDNTIPRNKIFSSPVELQDLASPYLLKVLALNTRKIYWETKRGCKFKCGFCEWGNATNKMVPLDNERLFKEIELIKNSSIDEVNILDGTFNIGRYYLTIFKKLLEIPDLHITCQARFESLFGHKATEFIRLCAENKHRVHLEFGLQTIHEKEMAIIGRKNRIDRIEKAMQILLENQIDYETSIIYAIPGQTTLSFIDTIEFLIESGCKVIKAYPLQIPKNSKMENKRIEYAVNEGIDKYNVKSVISTYSFSKEQREDMDRIANRLNSGQITVRDKRKHMLNQLHYETVSTYLSKIKSSKKEVLDPLIIERIKTDYLNPTISNIENEDFTQASFLKSQFPNPRNTKQYSDWCSDFISGKKSLTIRKSWANLDSIIPGLSEIQNINFNPDLSPRKYTCNLVISRSGNIYAYRSIELMAD